MGGLVATIVTLALWFAGLAFLKWTLEQGVDAGLGPSVLYYVVFPVALAGFAWVAGSAAWRLAQAEPDDEITSSSRRDAARRAGLVAPFVALVVNQVVWNASLDRFDWLNSFGFDPFNLATLVVLIVFPLLLAGVTIWAGLAVRR